MRRIYVNGDVPAKLEATGSTSFEYAGIMERTASKAMCAYARARAKLADKSGQGTTEYAILVGVLVVIAILAITIFRPKIQELWDAISTGINGL